MRHGGLELDGRDGAGTVWVNANGPTTVSVLINGKSSQTARIKAGQTVHQFDFTNVDPASVRTVLVRASDSPQEKGGACMADGSPTA